MRSLLLLALLALLAFSQISSARAGGGGGGEEETNDPDVIKLDDTNFNSVVDGEDVILVEFYAPWCGHCKRLTPEYAKAATALLKNDPPIKLAKVDATVSNSLAGKYDVRGYPTMKVFRNGKDFPYNGPRDAEGIINYMKKQAGPAAKPVDSLAALEKFLSGEERFFVLGLFSSPSSTLQSGFSVTANKLRDDYTFLKSSNSEVFAKYGVEANGEAIIALKKYDDETTRFTDKPKQLEEWVVRNSLPLVGEFNAKYAPLYAKRNLPVFKLYAKVDFSSPTNAKQANYYVNRVKPLAVEYQGKVLFALVDSTKNAADFADMGFKDKAVPIFIEQGKTKYAYREKFTTESIKEWVQQFLDGKAERHIKSEEPPASNDGPVKVIVGKTFDDIVMDKTKDVLIEFYAPWCGHCKKLEPIYEKLGKKMQSFDNVVIAKMDATANDYPPQFEVSGFPTIYFKPAKKTTPVKYEGAREVADFEKFIKKHATNSMEKKKGKKDKKDQDL